MIGKGHSFQCFRDGIAHLVGIVFQNDRHLLAGDIAVRGKGCGGYAIHNAGLCRPVDIGGIAGIGLHVCKCSVLIIRRVNPCQTSKSGDEHSPCQGAVRTEGGFAGAGEQPTADGKEDMLLCPMTVNVGEVRNRILIAHAVDAEMLCFKNHGFLIRIIAGFGEPLYLAASIHRNRIQVSGLLILRRSIRKSNADGLSVQAGNLCFFPVLNIPEGNIIGWGGCRWLPWPPGRKQPLF